MRRVRTNEEHNKKRSLEVNGVGARPGVVCEVWGHYWSNRSTELTWCYNRISCSDRGKMKKNRRKNMGVFF